MMWLDRLLDSTEESEAPRSYYYWAGLVAIATVMKNQVWLDRFYYKLYPNIYVMLIGKSGIRKGPAIALAKRLASEVNNTRIISGRVSIQAVVKELSTAMTKPGQPVPLIDAVGALFASEFASFIIQDPAALTILTDLYDGHYHPEWTNTTKGGGAEKLKNPTITLFGASNEVHFREAVPDNALGGGFIARTFIIYADKRSRNNSLTDKPLKMVPPGEMAKYLFELSKLHGEFIWTPEGKDVYNEWYERISKEELEEDTGSLERIGDQALKVAMLLSLARGTDLLLTGPIISEAINAAMVTIPGLRKVTLGAKGKSDLKEGTAVVLRTILKERIISRTALLQRNWGHFDANTLDKILETLTQARIVTLKDEQIKVEGKPLGHIEKMVVLNEDVANKYQQLRGESQ